MKELKRKILLLPCMLLLAAAVFGFAACGGGNGDTGSTVQNHQIADFETWDDLYKLRFTNRFRADLNTDTQYLTSGAASLKIEMQETVEMRIDLCDQDGNGADLTKIKNVQFDLFNTTNKEQDIGVAIAFGADTTDYVSVKAAAGKSRLTAAFNASLLSIGYKLSDGKAIVIRFPAAQSAGAFNEFYIDDVAIEYLLRAPNAIGLDLDEGEFCSFDKYFQPYVVKSGGIGPTEGCYPILSKNADLRYCKDFIGYSLKVVLPAGTPPINDGWPNFGINAAYIDAFDFTALALSGKEFVFDVYNTGSPFNFGFEIGAKDKEKSAGYALAITMASGWNEIRIPVSDWNIPTEQSVLIDEESKIPLTDQIGTMIFSYSKFLGKEKTFYFDNLRFE